METAEQIISKIKGSVTKKDAELIKKAYDFSFKAHEGQKRMSSEPYFVHVVETVKILISLGLDARTVAAGFLHDVLEDSQTPEKTEEEIKKEFGDEILFLVKGVTKLGTLKYRGQERHVESLRKFFVAMAQDLRVVMIKFADRLHNLRTLEHVREDKRQRIALESIEVYAPLANRLGIGKLKGEIEDAAFPYAYPKEYKVVEEILQQKKEPYQKYLSEVKERLKKELGKSKIKYASIDYRIKHKFSLYKKLIKYNQDIDKIHDIVALRVVVETIEDCYRVLGIIHAIWNPLPGRIKDYIAVPKPNGYRSIHTTIFTGYGGIAELQIRTKEMHLEAEYGVAAHYVYKEQNPKKKKVDTNIDVRWLEELKEYNTWRDRPENFISHLKMDFFNDRIFVFTPKGDVIDLPEDSTPVDFAYSIHSDIGDHAFAAKVSGKISPLFSKLKNGDIVEITTKKDSHPSSKWLGSVKTTIAKKHIKSYLEKNSLLSKLRSFGRS